jgi:chaperonin cofactor prefoldin
MSEDRIKKLERRVDTLEERIGKLSDKVDQLAPKIQGEFNTRDSTMRKLREDVDKLLKGR